MLRLCWLSPLILITTLRILHQTNMAGQRPAPDNEVTMATVAAEDLHGWVCERGKRASGLTGASAQTNHSHFTLSCFHLRTMKALEEQTDAR